MAVEPAVERRALLPVRGGLSVTLVTLTVLAATCFLTANVVAVKLVSIAGHVVPGGAVVYPLTFLIDDVIVEIYGYRVARRAIWLGFLSNLVFVAAAAVVLGLPSAPFWHQQAAYHDILGYDWRIFCAATASYVLGAFSNAIVMSRMKVLTRSRALWSRTIASTVVGQGVDSLVFVSVAYGGTTSWHALRSVIITVWVFKVVYEVICTPVVYRVVRIVKHVEGRDALDVGIGYAPLPGLRPIWNALVSRVRPTSSEITS